MILKVVRIDLWLLVPYMSAFYFGAFRLTAKTRIRQISLEATYPSRQGFRTCVGQTHRDQR
jgi:hypothetical protein